MGVCPEHANVKQPASGCGLEDGTPCIEPTTRACIACEDMPCAAACETGALTKVPWDTVHMGILELDPQRCITFQGAECGVGACAGPIGDKALALADLGRPGLTPEGWVVSGE